MRLLLIAVVVLVAIALAIVLWLTSVLPSPSRRLRPDPPPDHRTISPSARPPRKPPPAPPASIHACPKHRRRSAGLGPPRSRVEGTQPPLHQLWTGVTQELRAIDPIRTGTTSLPRRRAVALIAAMESEVNNGGFDQYYLKLRRRARASARESAAGWAWTSSRRMVEKANAQFPQGPPADRATRLTQMDQLPARPARSGINSAMSSTR